MSAKINSPGPAVIDVDIEEHQVLVGLERGQVSISIAAPPDVDAQDLWLVLSEAPDSIETAVGLYGGDLDG